MDKELTVMLLTIPELRAWKHTNKYGDCPCGSGIKKKDCCMDLILKESSLRLEDHPKE